MVLEEAVQVESHCCHQDETVVHEALERPVVVADQEEKAEIRQILHLLMVEMFLASLLVVNLVMASAL